MLYTCRKIENWKITNVSGGEDTEVSNGKGTEVSNRKGTEEIKQIFFSNFNNYVETSFGHFIKEDGDELLWRTNLLQAL